MNRLREQTRDWVIIGLGAWVMFPPVWFVVPPPPWGHHWMMRNGFLPPHEGPDRGERPRPDRPRPGPPHEAERW